MDQEPATGPQPEEQAPLTRVERDDAVEAGTEPTYARRRFLRWLAGLAVFSTLAMIVTPIVGFLVPPRTSGTSGGGKVAVAATGDIPPGTGKVVALGNKPVIVTNTDQGLRAYSAICTHLGCVVAYNDLAAVIQCPCHDGRFNPVSGAVVSGPPPAPLPPVTVSVEGDQIFLSEA